MNVQHLDHDPRPERDEALEAEMRSAAVEAAKQFPHLFPNLYREFVRTGEIAATEEN